LCGGEVGKGIHINSIVNFTAVNPTATSTTISHLNTVITIITTSITISTTASFCFFSVTFWTIQFADQALRDVE
jgi:hypothetical protein